MISDIGNIENQNFRSHKKVLSSDPSSFMLTLIGQDKRLYFSYCISRKIFLYTNTAFTNFFGEEVIALPGSILKYIHPKSVFTLKRCFVGLQTGIVENDIVFSVNLPKQKEHQLSMNLVYNKNANGDAALTGYAEVITPDKLQPEEYHTKKKNMLNILSHDLLSPMGSIHNLAALLSRKKDLQQDTEANKWVALIEVISKKSINIIRAFVEKEFPEPGATSSKKYL